MRLFEKGQGATEYLLMLAAVLVIVAIAIAYILGTAPGGVAPTITANVTATKGSDNFTLEVTKVSATVSQADWQYSAWYQGESQPTTWASSPGDLKAGSYSLPINGSYNDNGTYNVWLYHVPTKSIFYKTTVDKPD